MDKVFIVCQMVVYKRDYKAVFTSEVLAQKYIDKHKDKLKLHIIQKDLNPNADCIERGDNFYIVQFDNAGDTIRAEKLDNLPLHNLVEQSYLDYGESKAFELFAPSLEDAIQKAKLRFSNLQQR